MLPVTLEVGITTDMRRLDGWLLALQARGIPADVHHADGTAALHVLPIHADAARVELDATDVEEMERRRAHAVIPDDVHSRYAPFGGVLFALLLIGFYLVTGPSSAHSMWFGAGASDAERVLSGEWWRTVTALTLHADSHHVLSNVAIGGIVVTAVMRRTGVGWGAALVVLAGALGNLVNAWGYGTHHSSIGFSTAVFGAIGILGGLTFTSAARDTTRRGRPAWVAIAGSVALLAMLGASERSDMLAHLFGMFVGLALGLAVGRAGWQPRTWYGQAFVGMATAALVMGAWAAAVRG